MFNSATHRSAPTFTRAVLHGNAKNKRGVTTEAFRKAGKDPLARIHRGGAAVQGHGRRAHDTGFSPAPQRAFGDLVVRGRPPKPEAQRVVLSSETRFTIPPRPCNANILQQTALRSQGVLGELLVELRSAYKARTFAIDEEHEIEVVT